MKALLLATLVLSGCATQGIGSNYQPLVDTKDYTQYHKDLAECQTYASQHAGASDGAMVGIFIGAVVGLLANAVGGGGFRNELAGVGALTGALQGAASNEGTQRDIIRRCLVGRGHSVLN